MGFIFKSLFWAGIVFLFLPRGPSDPLADAKREAQRTRISVGAVVDAASASAGLCRAQPEICESVLKTGAAGRDIFTTLAASLPAKLRRKDKSATS